MDHARPSDAYSRWDRPILERLQPRVLLDAAMAGPFVDVDAALADVDSSSCAWGDYDGDGDLDVLVTGWTVLDEVVTEIYNNDAGTFVDADAGLEGVYWGAAEWGDYDNDGDLDVLLTGYNAADAPLTEIYRNDGGTFTDVNAGLVDVLDSSAAWGDYDNDGDLDVAVMGFSMLDGLVTRVYRNTAGTFTDIAAGLDGSSVGSLAWGDYDSDGDPDLLVTGLSVDQTAVSIVYQNDAGVFSEAGVGLVGIYAGTAAWGDYDADGDLDIVLAGYNNFDEPTPRVYRNDAGVFVDVLAALAEVADGAVAWGDADADGDLDILLTGWTTSDEPFTEVYRNDGGDSFTELDSGLEGVGNSSAAWGDYDGDDDLDLLLAGQTSLGDTVAKVYRNDVLEFNLAPLPPPGLSAGSAGLAATLSWNAATDDLTPPAGLTYNVRVGTTPGGGDVVSGMSLAADGTRLLPAWGNATHNLSHTFIAPATGTYYWSVQAVDTSFVASAWADEQTVVVSGDVAVGDRVWIDDGNGIQNDGEVGIGAVTVNLYDPGADGQVGGGDDTLVATTATDAGGTYLFENIAAGDYFVEFDAPQGYTFTRQDWGSDDTRDSDADPATGRTGVFALAAWQQDCTWDAGLLAPAPGEIHGVKWEDLDADGERDDGEWGLGDVTIFADLNGNGEPDDGEPTAETLYDNPQTPEDETGTYVLTDVPPGEHSVLEVVPDGYEQTFPRSAVGEATAFEFEDISATGTATMIGQDDATVSLPAGGLAGFEFRFFNTTHTEVHFSSNGLITFGAANDAYDNTDLTAWPDEACIAVFWDDLSVTGQDAAVYWQVLGGGDDQRLIVQWHNVEFVGGEGLGEITFQAVLTEADGGIQLNYLDLASGRASAEGDSATVGVKDAGEQGADRLLLCHDSGPNEYVAAGVSTRIETGGWRVTVDQGQGVGGINFGNTLTTSIGDRVWHDADADGVQDAGEDGIEGVTVRLYQPDGGDDVLVAATVTDFDGLYLFSGLAGGRVLRGVRAVAGRVLRPARRRGRRHAGQRRRRRHRADRRIHADGRPGGRLA